MTVVYFAVCTSRYPPGDSGPLQHAAPSNVSPFANPRRKTFDAVCGAHVSMRVASPSDDGIMLFDPTHPRACPKCKHQLERL